MQIKFTLSNLRAIVAAATEAEIGAEENIVLMSAAGRKEALRESTSDVIKRWPVSGLPEDLAQEEL